MTEIHTSAPGRVNLIGEHTDYNGGLVLPMPISQRTQVRLNARDDSTVVVTTQAYPDHAGHYRLGEEARTSTWLDYVMGCTAVLRDGGYRLRGCELVIASDVPLGSGLSSSAALEVAVLRALRRANDLDFDDLALALFAQRAENELVGAPVGAMDQMAASLGVEGEALFIDLGTFSSQAVPIPDTIEVVVIASGIRHDLAAGTGYRTRRDECDRAARALGVAQLRDAQTASTDTIAALPAPLDRRVRHVISENQRVVATVAALGRDDHAELRTLFAASHVSMRDDYEVSIPEIDLLVELADADPEAFGARLTGGGFGGSIVILVDANRGSAVAERVADTYRARTGASPRTLILRRPG